MEKIAGSYILVLKINTYAFGVHALQEACVNDHNSQHPTYETSNGAVIYRPLSFEQNFLARVERCVCCSCRAPKEDFDL